jgi:hypothetical protein
MIRLQYVQNIEARDIWFLLVISIISAYLRYLGRLKTPNNGDFNNFAFRGINNL